jgi:hypothetical protein
MQPTGGEQRDPSEEDKEGPRTVRVGGSAVLHASLCSAPPPPTLESHSCARAYVEGRCSSCTSASSTFQS